MKKIVISESSLTKLIQKTIGNKLNEQFESEFSVEPNIGKTPRESELEDVFGKYGGEIPADVIRYMRKNPKLVIQRLFDIYGEKLMDYIPYSKDNIKDVEMGDVTGFEDTKDALSIREQEEDNDDEFIKFPVDEFDFELTDSDMMDIYDYKGPTRRFRGSIYIDDLVPETDDREYDREVAKKMMEFYRKQIKNQESYVGGVGFKNRGNLIEPFDNMDF